MSERISWVDTGKLICISLVILSHLNFGTPILEILYVPFFLHVFTFLAGYVYRPPESFGKHFIHKARGLLLPWFLFSNLNILLSAVITFKGERNIPAELFMNLLQIRGIMDGIWYLAALFAAFMIFYFVIRMNKPQTAVILSVFLSFISKLYVALMPGELFPWKSPALPWHLEYICQMLLWMVLGYYFKGETEKKFDSFRWRIKAGIVVLYIILVYSQLLIPEDIDPVFHIPYGYIVEFTGIAATIYISKCIKTNRFIQFIGANTLCCFAMHGKFSAVLEKALELILGAYYERLCSMPVLSDLIGIAVVGAVLLLMIPPILFLNRYLPWAVGKSGIRKKALASGK